MINRRWFKPSRLRSIVKDATSVLGFFTVIAATVQFFPSLLPLSSMLQSWKILSLLSISSLVYGVANNRPKNSFVFKVKERDAEVGLWIGDVREVKGALVVPVNSEFDMDLNGSVKSAQSVKSMVIEKYFGGNHADLGKKINKELKNELYSEQKDGSWYRLGTAVFLESADKKGRFYFLANSHKINGKRVEADEAGLYASLNGLWTYISQHGPKGDITLPLLGTGNGRLTMPRQQVYEEIVKSFIASCAGKVYCDRLTIVIREEDVERYKIDVEHLVEFTRVQTQYAGFTNIQRPLVGRAAE